MQALRLPSGNYVESEFSNDESGFKKLVKWLRRHAKTNPVAWVVMEATNIYWEDVATHLHTQGYQVSVVNPLVIKGFGQSHLMREKTDKVDSLTMLHLSSESRFETRLA
ncbi:MAG: transposase [Chloroflexi bacterium]|nr:transposase [Chloroflexota bacterium]